MIQEIVQRIREDIDYNINEACERERDCNIVSTTMAMKELNIQDKDIIMALQKHFDLRISEAEGYIKRANRKMFTTIK